MTIGKKEKLLLIILVVLVYIFVFVKFIVLPGIPQINDTYKNIAELQKEEVSLDRDISNIVEKKAELQRGKLNNEKLQAYLPENADMTDGLDYLDKLSSMLGDIEQIRIYAPLEKKAVAPETENQKYYEMKLDFTTKLNYEDAINLLKYLEGSSLKLTVSKFSIVPISSENMSVLNMLEPKNNSNTINTTNPEIANTNKTMFDIGITVSLYSLDVGSSDKLFEYSRNTFNRYTNKEGELFIRPAEVSNPQIKSDNNAANTDIIIDEKSYLTAGPNLEISSTVIGTNILRVKSDKLQNITVTLDNSNYKIETIDENKKLLNLTGVILQNDLKVEINVDIPDIKENKNIRLKVKIINNTQKNLIITLNDVQKRAQITDRKGSTIFGNSSSEKVTIL